MEAVSSNRSPLSVRVAAWYLIVAAGFGIVMLLLASAPHYSGVPSNSSARIAGQYAREATLDVGFIVAGVGVLKSRMWGKQLGIVLLIISIFYGARSFAWGCAGGQPSPGIWIVSLLLSGLWYGLWIFLLSRWRRVSVPHDA